MSLLSAGTKAQNPAQAGCLCHSCVHEYFSRALLARNLPLHGQYTFSIFLWSQIIHSSSLVNFRDPASAIRTGMRIYFRPAQVSKNAKQLAFFSLVPSRGIFPYMDSIPFRHIRTESSCASKSFSIPRHTQSSLRVLRAHYKKPSLMSDGFL